MKLVIDIETTGLESTEERITCISLLNVDHDIPVSFYGEDEVKILEHFWNAIKEADEIITFNGDEFDIPFLIKRSLIKNVKISRMRKKTDLRKVVNSFFVSYQKKIVGGLDFWAKVLGFEQKTNDGKKMPEYYFRKDWKKIKEHCEEDCLVTKELYLRCVHCGVI